MYRYLLAFCTPPGLLVCASFAACPPGRWGDDCGNDCPCLNGAHCDPLSGDCTCGPGWKGNQGGKPVAALILRHPTHCMNMSRFKIGSKSHWKQRILQLRQILCRSAVQHQVSLRELRPGLPREVQVPERRLVRPRVGRLQLPRGLEGRTVSNWTRLRSFRPSEVNGRKGESLHPFFAERIFLYVAVRYGQQLKFRLCCRSLLAH